MRRAQGHVLMLALVVAIVVACLVLADEGAGSRPPSPEARARAVVCEVFGSRCMAAMRVVRCETGGTYNPRAVGGAGERGLFQIHPVHFRTFDRARLFDRRYNARAAYLLSQGGRDWHHWTCRP